MPPFRGVICGLRRHGGKKKWLANEEGGSQTGTQTSDGDGDGDGDGDLCAPANQDGACVACAKGSCCNPLIACLGDQVCLCAAACLQQLMDIDKCKLQCNADESDPVIANLSTCIDSNRLQVCGG